MTRLSQMGFDFSLKQNFMIDDSGLISEGSKVSVVKSVFWTDQFLI